MNKLTIKKVDASLLKELQDIGKKTFYETFAETNTKEDMEKYLNQSFSLQKLHKEILNTESSFYLATINGEEAGYLKVNWGKAQTESHNLHAFEIERIYVLSQYHGKEIGQAMYDKALNIAKNMNVKYVWLGVWEENPKAIRFYEKNGFTAFDKHSFFVGDDEQTDILMKLQI